MDNLVNSRSFTYNEIVNIDFDGPIDRYNPPSFLTDKTGRKYTVVKLSYNDPLKDGDVYFETEDSWGFVHNDHNYSNSHYYGSEQAFERYAPFRVLQKKRIG